MKNDGELFKTLEASIPPFDEKESGWLSLVRVAVFLGVSLVGVVAIYATLIFLLPERAMSYFDAAFRSLTYFWLFGNVLYFWGAIEKKTLPQMGLAFKATDLMAGFSIGFCAIFLLYGLGFVFNLVGLAPLKESLTPALAAAAGSALALTLLEEILFRGYLFQTLLTDMPPWLAAAMASFLYAMVHFIQPGVLMLPFISFFLAGLAFCYATWLTGNLSLTIGLHFSWLFILAFFGRLGLWTYHQPMLMGDGNPFNGLFGIACVLAIIAALRYVYGPLSPERPKRR